MNVFVAGSARPTKSVCETKPRLLSHNMLIWFKIGDVTAGAGVVHSDAFDTSLPLSCEHATEFDEASRSLGREAALKVIADARPGQNHLEPPDGVDIPDLGGPAVGQFIAQTGFA